MSDEYDDDAAPFERTPNTRHGNGSANAANKGRIKRLYAMERRTWGKKHKRSKR